MAERTSKYFFSQAVTPRDGPSIVEISHLVILSEVRISVWLIFLPKVFEAFPIPNLKFSGYFRSKHTVCCIHFFSQIGRLDYKWKSQTFYLTSKIFK